MIGRELMDEFVGSLILSVKSLTAAVHKQNIIMSLWLQQEGSDVCPACVLRELEKAPEFEASRVDPDAHEGYYEAAKVKAEKMVK